MKKNQENKSCHMQNDNAENNSNHKQHTNHKQENKSCHMQNDNAENNSNHKQHTNHKNSKKRFFLQIFIVILYFYFIAISIIEPKGVISYTWQPYIWFPITTFVVFFEGAIYFKSYKDLLKFKYGMNTLVAFAAHILYLYSSINSLINIGADAYSYGVMWEGAGVLIIFIQFGERMMQKIMQKSIDYETSLKSIENKKIAILRNGKKIITTVSNIKFNDILSIRHGDLVAVDGIALSNGVFNYENITGESKYINIAKNDRILSGSYNNGDNVQMKVTKTFKDSYISKIIVAINRFSKIRPRAQLFADKVLKYFVPIIFIIAILTFITLFTISQTANLSFPWITASGGKINTFQALSSSIAVVAVACPCAIGMATPIIYAVTSIIGSKNGIVINNPHAIEDIGAANTIAFDKTGTITETEMIVTNIEGDQSLIPIVKALEKDINHPIARVINNLEGKVASGVTDIKLKDDGVYGKFKNKIISIKTIPGDNHFTNLGLFIDNVLKLKIDLESKIKSNVKNTINYFKKNAFKTLLISGDNKNTCLNIAKKIEIDEVYYEKKPLQKTNIIAENQKQGKKVVFVGDGFNDSPAMRKANISMSFASGSDITNSLSDIMLVNNDFKTIEKVLKLSKINNRRIKLSLAYAFLFNIIALPFVILGFLQPWLAAIIMAMSNILVGLNGFSYLHYGSKKIKKNK